MVGLGWDENGYLLGSTNTNTKTNMSMVIQIPADG